MNTDPYLDRVVSFCGSCGYVLIPDAAECIADYQVRSISPSMAGALLVIQSLALDHTANDVIRLVRAAERAIECAKLLNLAQKAGQVTENELHDANAMLSAFIEPSDKSDRFAHSLLAQFGSMPLCENMRTPSPMEVKAEKSLMAAYENYTRPSKPPGIFDWLFGKSK